MIEKFLDKRYDERNYNCGHFAAELWFALTGERKYQLCEQTLMASVKSLIEIPKCQDPCIVFMKSDSLHAGVFYQGFIYHLTPTGVVSQTLDFVKQTSPILGFFK